VRRINKRDPGQAAGAYATANSPHAPQATAYPATQAIRGGEASDRPLVSPAQWSRDDPDKGEEENALNLRLDFMPAPSDGRAENTEYRPLENGAGEEDGVVK
jgi:hypothetical protein